MNQTRLLTIIASLVACAPNGLSAETLSAETVYPPAPNATVSVYACGANPIVAVGSSPYNGSVTPTPDLSLYTCTIGFATTAQKSPFTVVPICTAQIQGPRTKWTVALTADEIQFVWDKVIFGTRVPPERISWICQ